MDYAQSYLNDLIILKDVNLNLHGKNNLCMPDYNYRLLWKEKF